MQTKNIKRSAKVTRRQKQIQTKRKEYYFKDYNLHNSNRNIILSNIRDVDNDIYNDSNET